EPRCGRGRRSLHDRRPLPAGDFGHRHSRGDRDDPALRRSAAGDGGHPDGHPSGTTKMETPVHPDVVVKALRKITAAVEGMGHKPVAIGAVARRSWGAKGEPQRVELLLPT